MKFNTYNGIVDSRKLNNWVKYLEVIYFLCHCFTIEEWLECVGINCCVLRYPIRMIIEKYAHSLFMKYDYVIHYYFKNPLFLSELYSINDSNTKYRYLEAK